MGTKKYKYIADKKVTRYVVCIDGKEETQSFRLERAKEVVVDKKRKDPSSEVAIKSVTFIGYVQ